MKPSQSVSERAGRSGDTQDTIKVVIRFKGGERLSDQEMQKWQVDEDCKSVQAPPPPGDKRTNMDTLRYTFDDILVEASQEKMYYFAGQETVKLFTQGFNGTIFAYGMSGTGKTYSMLGPETVVDVIKSGQEIPDEVQAQYGIIPRAIRDIFEFMNNSIETEGAQFELMMNYFEIYKESLNDLLQPNKDIACNLKMMGSKIINSYKVMIDSPETIFDNIKRGQQRVHTEATGMNDRSSRSHSILQFEYNQINKDGSKKNAKLNLVDLAGSERISKTGATGKVLEEAKKINLSLTILGRVIQALGEGTNVPFRESTLTRLLKEGLGGNSKTALICTTSRSDSHVEETIQSLQFAKRVKKVKNKAVVSVQLTSEQMQTLIVKLKQEVYLLRQKLIVTNGGVAPASRKELEAEAPPDGKVAKKVENKVEDKAKPALTRKNTSEKPLLSARRGSAAKTTMTPRASAAAAKEKPQLSIDTQKKQIKDQLKESVASTPKVELEVVNEEYRIHAENKVEVKAEDKAEDKAEKKAEDKNKTNPTMLRTPGKDIKNDVTPDKAVEGQTDQPQVVEEAAISPFKTPAKEDDKSATKRDHSFLQSFGSDQMSLRKSLIENPYSSFISLQSEYFDTQTKVTNIQDQSRDQLTNNNKLNLEQFETLQELIQRQQVQLDSRNDLLIQRDSEIDKLYNENSSLTKSKEGLQEKIDNQAMDVYFKVAEEMNKQFKQYYTSKDSYQQMDELLSDLKRQAEQGDEGDKKSIFSNINDIEFEMQKYDKWIKQTRLDMNQTKNADLSLKTDVTVNKLEEQSKIVEGDSIMKKENLDSLQQVLNNQKEKLTKESESKTIDYYNSDSVRQALVNQTLTCLHVLHQYKSVLNLVKDNYMTKPRKQQRVTSPNKGLVVVDTIKEAKTEGEPNSGINLMVSASPIQPGSFKDDESKPTCDTDKDLIQVVPETQELLQLRNQVKIQNDLYQEKIGEIKKSNELVERLKRQHENLREQINRVDKENIKMKKKMDLDNLNKQQQYYAAQQQQSQQFSDGTSYYGNKGAAPGTPGWSDYASNVYNGTRQVIASKVSMTSKFFSSNVFNGPKPGYQQQQAGYSPGVHGRYQNTLGQKQLRANSPGKRNQMSTNAYEYRSNPASKLVNNPELRGTQSTDSNTFQKRAPKMKDVNSAVPFIPQDIQNQTFDVNGMDNSARKSNAGRESILSVQSSDQQMQKVQLSINNVPGNNSFLSNNSFRIAGQPIAIDAAQAVEQIATPVNFMQNKQMQYQAKPKLSPMKTDRGIKEGMAIDMTQLNMEGTQTIQAPSTPQMKPMPRVKKYSRQEMENRPGKYDNDNFYILPDGDFFDPQGFYFDKKGYDQLGGHYDNVTGHYIPGTKYAACTLQKNQSYNAGETNRPYKNNKRFTGFEQGSGIMQTDNLRKNYGSFHAPQTQGFYGQGSGQQYSNFFPNKGNKPNNPYFQNAQEFPRRNTQYHNSGAADQSNDMTVNIPAKDRKQRNTEAGSAQLNQSAASSQNNSKAKGKEPSAHDAAQTNGAAEEEMVVTKL